MPLSKWQLTARSLNWRRKGMFEIRINKHTCNVSYDTNNTCKCLQDLPELQVVLPLFGDFFPRGVPWKPKAHLAETKIQPNRIDSSSSLTCSSTFDSCFCIVTLSVFLEKSEWKKLTQLVL
jgi:hypothetical protein